MRTFAAVISWLLLLQQQLLLPVLPYYSCSCSCSGSYSYCYSYSDSYSDYYYYYYDYYYSYSYSYSYSYYYYSYYYYYNNHYHLPPLLLRQSCPVAPNPNYDPFFVLSCSIRPPKP